MGRLDGKVAIITGAGANLGRGISLRFAAEGARVAVVDVDEANAKETCRLIDGAGGQSMPMSLDVSDEAAMQAMVQAVVSAWGGVHVLHNNAVYRNYPKVGQHPLSDFEPAVWSREFEVNVIGPALGCKYAVPHMISGGGGVILNTSSVNGFVGDLHRPQYGLCKAAINNLTKSIAVLYGRHNVRCNAIAPGLFPRAGAEAHPYGVVDSPYASPDRRQLIQRRGTPDDVANLALFLASDEASFITGRVIPCDGGLIGVQHFDYADLVPLPGEASLAAPPWSGGSEG